MVIAQPMSTESIYSTENDMFTHEPVARTTMSFFYGSGCAEAVLTYVPQDINGLIHAHMWIGMGQHSSDSSLCASIFSIRGFPGASFSTFAGAYSVLYFAQHPSLSPNKAIAIAHAGHCDTQWFGDVLVLKHIGHNFATYQSMTYDEKGLVDAILQWYFDAFMVAQSLAFPIA
ncbi:hypothetical protein F4604DRAFT_1922780 [Suillus subluteus]|nr:hypothetical protein F4604DRAFT_1922780 [Suillus subluteus]